MVTTESAAALEPDVLPGEGLGLASPAELYPRRWLHSLRIDGLGLRENGVLAVRIAAPFPEGGVKTGACAKSVIGLRLSSFFNGPQLGGCL